MNAINIYNEIDGEIEIIQTRINDLQTERKILLQKMMMPHMGSLTANYSGMPGSPFNAEPVDKQYLRLTEIERKVEELESILSAKMGARRDIGEKLKELEGLEYDVFRMHKIEGKSLNQIADELHYSYNHIRRINMEINQSCNSDATLSMI